jgi:hypothetical protein
VSLAVWIVHLIEAYALAGFVFAIPFVAWGVQRIDPVAKGAPITFRCLIFPGVVALWPLFLTRWVRPKPWKKANP